VVVESEGRQGRGEERSGEGGGRGKLNRHVRAAAAMVACERIFPHSEIRSEQSPDVYNCTLSMQVTYIKVDGCVFITEPVLIQKK